MTLRSDALTLGTPGPRGQMTRMLVRVTNAKEASQADAAGVDVVELDMGGPRNADHEITRDVRSAFSRRLRLRADDPVLTPELAEMATSLRADEIALPLAPAAGTSVDAARPQSLDLIGRVSTESNASNPMTRFEPRVNAVMLESGQAARLVDYVGIPGLHAFASRCARYGLPFGFSGMLEAPDISRLLLLAPDVLGFDSAVRVGLQPDGALDAAALQTIRALIPGSNETAPARETPSTLTDRVFVRDFVQLLSIGAYQAELGPRQRVRFSVEADVQRGPRAPRDMRDVFSYDIILETIRVLAQRAHVTFVETLAEDLATALLAHAAVVATTIKIEKLDVIDGAVGIEICRRRRP